MNPRQMRAPRRVYDFRLPDEVREQLLHVCQMPAPIGWWALRANDGLLYGMLFDSDAWVLANRVIPRRRKEIPRTVRAAVILRDGGKCQTCGSSDDIQLDHIVPWSRGGLDIASNLQCLCGRCNRAKWHVDKIGAAS